MGIPTHPGRWRRLDTGEVLDVYDLEPVGQLCIWNDDLKEGGGLDFTEVWSMNGLATSLSTVLAGIG